MLPSSNELTYFYFKYSRDSYLHSSNIYLVSLRVFKVYLFNVIKIDRKMKVKK